MSLVSLDGTPLVLVGGTGREGGTTLATSTSSTILDAAGEAAIMLGQIFTEDGGSHTIDTTGSSSLGWRAAASTFANAGTTLKVGLADVDTATGPPGRAVNVADVITFDVVRSITGGAGLSSADWNEHVPTSGTKTIAHGDLVAFCLQMTARAGADSVAVQTGAASGGPQMPQVTNYVAAAYAGNNSLPNAVITFSDGALGFFYGGQVFSTNANTTWNNTSGTKEYGNYLQLPVPGKAYGALVNNNVAGDLDVVLYSDPLGTPVAERTVSFDLNQAGAGLTQRWMPALFSSPYSFTANQPLALIMKPTSATNVTAPNKSFNIAAHQKSETLGANCYAVNRNTGAFAAQNSNKDRYGIGLLVGAFDAGGSGGGGGAVFGSQGGVVL